LGIFASMTRKRESTLAEFVASNSSTTDWTTALLVGGGYNGSDNDILGIIANEINEGAVEVLRGADRSTSVGRLLHGASVALLRFSGSNQTSTTRTRLRGKAQATMLSAVVGATAKLGTRPGVGANASVWQDRLVEVARAWGNGWVLFQAVACLPANVDIGTMATAVQHKHPELSARLTAEAEARANRRSTNWWRDRLAVASTDASKREWLFGVLACAYSQVVIDLASEVDGQVNALAPKHFTLIREALRHFRKLGLSHQLVLNDALRLNQVTLSVRSLWLARVVATDGSIEQIDKRLTGAFPDLLKSEPVDLRELTRVVGRGKKIPFATFKGHRSALPSGGWASNINIGAMTAKTPEEVLKAPAHWPADLVQRAVEHVEKRMLTGLGTVAEVASANSWFEDV
jgi:hypothetical protein